jgi:hypothetical protein
MPVLRKSPDQRAAEEAARGEWEAAKRQQKRRKAFEDAWNAFWASPAGQARLAFDRGDHVFQYSLDVMNQQAIIVAMVGSATSKTQADPTSVLNSVCHEGWELVNGDFVFVTEGQQSRDKFMSSGQNVAIKGMVVGYYLFKRNETNRRVETEEQLKQRLLEPIDRALG